MRCELAQGFESNTMDEFLMAAAMQIHQGLRGLNSKSLLHSSYGRE